MTLIFDLIKAQICCMCRYNNFEFSFLPGIDSLHNKSKKLWKFSDLLIYCSSLNAKYRRTDIFPRWQWDRVSWYTIVDPWKPGMRPGIREEVKNVLFVLYYIDFPFLCKIKLIFLKHAFKNPLNYKFTIWHVCWNVTDTNACQFWQEVPNIWDKITLYLLRKFFVGW